MNEAKTLGINNYDVVSQLRQTRLSEGGPYKADGEGKLGGLGAS